VIKERVANSEVTAETIFIIGKVRIKVALQKNNIMLYSHSDAYLCMIPHNFFLPKNKKQMIILSVWHAGIVTRQVHRTTSSSRELGFLKVW
jgi:hypothetical protein